MGHFGRDGKVIMVVNGTVSGLEILEITGGLISEITGEPGPKRSRRKTPVDQKISWSSIPGKGPTGDPEDVTTNSPEEFRRINGHSESG
jgi:hypothetical protein